MVSVEIGHGGVLIRHPSSIEGGEEESEASSLSVDNKVLSVNMPTTGSERIKKPFGQGMDQELMKSFRDKDQLEELPILAHLDSPLGYIDLQDVKCEEISNGTESTVVGTNDIKQPQDGHLPNDSDGNAAIKSQKTATNRGRNDTIKNDGSSYSPKLPSNHNHCLELIDPIGFATVSSFHQREEEEEEDLLLLDVPSNSSFPQAELFFPIPSSFLSHQASPSCTSVYHCNLACPMN
ncbi:unnamed protein product [Cuscuta campestris]|uniref:Uncharacterized protein n=1 Tax=Cuscuta campestris TaxID=132261 RepID=A0A484NM63_9ASTE|nr:unnamed protein product [Cuscuta campestris]